MLDRDDRKEDELLAIRCQLGEPAAFDALIARWHEPLWKYLRRLTGDDEAAAEAVQDTWLRILRGMPRLRDCARVRAWIFGIARRVVMDRLRVKYAEAGRVSTGEVDLPIEEESSDLKEELLLLQEELSRLPVPEREVLVLFYLEELTLIEIADVVGIPAGTVKSRLFRARKALRDQLVRKGVKR
jgi:RNA polymerase sigma-70 factor (ECF subfamily)